jgi:hypothetical protein
MAILESTIEAVKSTSGDVAGAAQRGVESIGEQVSALASKVSDLIEPEPKHSSKGWWLGAIVLVAAAVALVWWRRSSSSTADEERTDASGAPRQTGVRAVV